MPASLRGEIEALIRQGRQVEAIKKLRRAEGLDLRQAVEEIERIETRLAGAAPDPDSGAAHAGRPSQRMLEEVKTLVLQGRKMEAIKLLHEGNRMGLRQAKNLVEAVTRESR